MIILAIDLKFDDEMMHVTLSDGRALSVPLNWFPRLMAANPLDRLNFTITQAGIHWDTLDEDISIEGLLAGRGDQTRSPDRAA